jgi:uncharacterized protein YkwD
MHRSKLLLLAATLLTTTCTLPRQVDPPTPPPLATPDQIRVVADLVNEHRREKGCKPLTWLSPVAAVAQDHSRDMAIHKFFSHTNQFGESPFQRLARAGIKYQRAAENIAVGQRTGAAVVRSWLQSPGHRRNIEDCLLQQHGIGLHQNYWTHVFVTLPK